MSQVSKPFQYILVLLLVFAAAWFLVLRPSDEDDGGGPVPAAATPAATAPGVDGLTSAVDKAKSAVETSNATPDGKTGGTGGPATTPATPDAPATSSPVAKPGGAAKTGTGDPSAPIITAIGAGKVAVVLFYEKDASDDRAVHEAIRELPRHGGRVAVFSAPIADIGHYQAITRGVTVQSAPTVLVIGADGSTRSITGYTDVAEIDQIVSDALKRPVASDLPPSAPHAA